MKILATVLMLGALSGAGAQAGPAYPDRPIRIEVGFPPGGAIDTIARTIAPKMAESMGQAVVVENRPGAGGIISAQSVARSSPDGYTLFMGTMGNFSITPALKKDLPYSVEKDFAPITLVASSDFVLYVNPNLPVKSVSELITYSKSHPQGIHFSSSGLGGLPHMAGEMFNAATGAKMVHVPYKGSSPSISDVMAGQVQLTFEAAAIGLPFVKAGKLRALATTGEKRSPSFPDAAAVNETGSRQGHARPHRRFDAAQPGRGAGGQYARIVRRLSQGREPALGPSHRGRRHQAGLVTSIHST